MGTFKITKIVNIIKRQVKIKWLFKKYMDKSWEEKQIKKVPKGFSVPNQLQNKEKYKDYWNLLTAKMMMKCREIIIIMALKIVLKVLKEYIPKILEWEVNHRWTTFLQLIIQIRWKCPQLISKIINPNMDFYMNKIEKMQKKAIIE